MHVCLLHVPSEQIYIKGGSLFPSPKQWNSFPGWEKSPGDGICRRAFEHLFSKERETVFQFSSNSSRQNHDVAYTVDTVDMVYNGGQIFGSYPVDSYDY